MSKSFESAAELLQACAPRRGDPECPSWLRLDQWRLGELAGEQRLALEAHVSGCGTCQERLRAEAEAFASAVVNTAAAGSGAALQRVPPPRQLLRSTIAALALAAALLLALRPSFESSSPSTRVKGAGALSLTVFREHEGKVSQLHAGDSAVPGDRLRFAIRAPEGAHVLIFGTEASGRSFVYYPAGGRGRSAKHRPANNPALDGAAELDASLGEETISLMVCSESFELPAARAPSPAGCALESLAFRKVAR